MFLTERKFEERIRELEGYRYRDLKGIHQFIAQEDDDSIGAYPPAVWWTKGDEYRRLLERPRSLYLASCRDWYSFAICRSADCRSILVWKNGRGNNSGFESLLFVNGKPYQGVDSNHEEVLFDNQTAKGTMRLDFRLWSGLEGGGVPTENEFKLQIAAIGWLDQRVDNLYYTLLAAMKW